ncbi:hypothetical protein [Spirulina sp. 06S082]|uniref:hypothetical protein n=1 Tax=Spirulina sp. 06S082 TaxID=3110248 RepID=UPI002B204216|nr:hypothetical protein [Spirulina sp. 06S082]MEA5467756.1 hypothetical protein [Spirulina sp. 06S082]
MKRAIGLAGVAAMGLAFSAPAAIAEINLQEISATTQDSFLVADNDLAALGDYSLTGEEFDPLTSLNQFYSLEAWDLIRQGFICVNNPTEDCTGEVLEAFDPDSHQIPVPNYEVTEETREGFACVNNVNPACENFVHYGVIYADPEPEIPLNARIAALWAELDELDSRPASLPAPAPESPILAPVPGLW